MLEKAQIGKQVQPIINSATDKRILTVIAVLSIAIPVVVALLIYIPQTGALGGFDVSFLPTLNACLNAGTAICITVAFIFIKQKNIAVHRGLMLGAFSLSSIFLVSYVLYHFQGPKTLFGDLDHNGIVSEAEKVTAGTIRYVYYGLLLTHIVLATVIVPFVLLSIYYGISNQISKHKRISVFTFPMWLYVAVTGVLVYLLISPYYKG